MVSILVTGCAGLIGSKFCDWIVENIDSAKVIGLDNLSGGYIENVNNKVLFHKVDLTEYDEVAKIFEKNSIDYVYHFAAYAAEGLSPFIRKFNYTNNLLCTTNLVNLSIIHRIKRFVFTSSMATYGDGDKNPPFSEDTRQIPIDPYGIAKLACELDIKVAWNQHGLEYCIIRPHNVYGENQNIWDKYRNVLGIWMNQIIRGDPITIFGDGEQRRAFTYIDDIMEPLWNATKEMSRNQEINLGGITECTINDAAETLCEIVGGDVSIVKLQGRHEVKNAYCTHMKSVDLLSFEMRTSLRDGLAKMWAWARKQPYRSQMKWDRFEIEDGLYGYWK